MQFLENKYSRTYFLIVERAKTRQLQCYCEKHHIIPKSMGGSNKKENLVNLTPKEHFIVHHLLVSMTEGKIRSKMVFAFWSLSRRNKHQTGKRVTAIFYDKIKKLHSEVCKTRNTSRVYKGGYKKPHTEESKKNIGIANKGKVFYHNKSTGHVKAFKVDEVPDGYVKGNPRNLITKNALGTKWCHNPETFEVRRIPKLNDLPSGFINGDLKIWISNPISGHRTFHNMYKQLPEGYVKGRIGYNTNIKTPQR